jgi:hypothetical protein
MRPEFDKLLKKQQKLFGEVTGLALAKEIADQKGLIPFVREKPYGRCWKKQKL